MAAKATTATKKTEAPSGDPYKVWQAVETGDSTETRRLYPLQKTLAARAIPTRKNRTAVRQNLENAPEDQTQGTLPDRQAMAIRQETAWANRRQVRTKVQEGPYPPRTTTDPVPKGLETNQSAKAEAT